MVANAVFHNHFDIIDGVLFKLTGTEKRLVIPKELQPQVLHAAHTHRGARKMIGVLRSRVWWVGLYKHAKEWTRCCDACQRNQPRLRHGLLQHAVPLHALPFRRICADICGPISTQPTALGNTHLLVVVCMSTRWTEAYPLKGPGDHSDLSKCLLDWFSKYGVPERIHSDQGSQFMAQALAQAYEAVGIKRTRTTPYFPSGDPTERHIGSIVRTLRALCHDNGSEWDTQLPLALMALRAEINETTGCSPFEMIHGIPMRLPIDQNIGSEPVSRPTPLHGLAIRLERLRQAIATHEERERARYKKRYDRSRKEAKFSVGDLVLLHYPTMASGQPSRKLALHWRGPYRVLGTIQGSPNIYRVGDDNNKDIQVVNVRRMRKYYTLPPELQLEPTPAPNASKGQELKANEPRDEATNEWELECLMGKRKRKGVTFYLVRWRGNWDPTWEPASNIPPDIIEDYERLTSGFQRH
jgi:transposase InsO family protein